MSEEKTGKKIRFHHVAILAKTRIIENLLTGFINLPVRSWYNKDQHVDVTFLPLGNAYIEMVYPHGNENLEKSLQSRGEGIYHFCFEVDDLDYWAKMCEEKGYKIVSRDVRCFFIHPKTFGGILVEFVNWPEGDPMGELSLMDKT